LPHELGNHLAKGVKAFIVLEVEAAGFHEQIFLESRIVFLCLFAEFFCRNAKGVKPLESAHAIRSERADSSLEALCNHFVIFLGHDFTFNSYWFGAVFIAALIK
jgi:hypothetical protein